MRNDVLTDEERAADMTILRRVTDAHDAMRKASTRVMRTTHPVRLEAAREAYKLAEAAYRKVADERDRHFEIRRCVIAQRSGEPNR